MKKNVWILVLGIIAVASIIIVYLLRNPDKTRTVYCGPDKTDPAIVFINPDEAFPSFATGYTVKLQAGVDLMDTLSKAASDINAGSEIQTQIIELRERLNQDNIRMENLLKASFYAYNSRPCSPEIAKRYQDMLDTLGKKITEIENLKSSVVTTEKPGPEPVDSVPSAPEISKDTAKIRKAIFQYNKKFTALRLSELKVKQP